MRDVLLGCHCLSVCRYRRRRCNFLKIMRGKDVRASRKRRRIGGGSVAGAEPRISGAIVAARKKETVTRCLYHKHRSCSGILVASRLRFCTRTVHFTCPLHTVLLSWVFAWEERKGAIWLKGIFYPEGVWTYAHTTRAHTQASHEMDTRDIFIHRERSQMHQMHDEG